MGTATPTIARQGFDTTDPEVANHALARMYGDVRSWVFGDPEGFTYRLRSALTPGLATARMRFTMGFGIDAELATSHHTLLAMIGGDHYHVASRYGDVVLRAGDLAVVPAGAGLEVSLEALDVVTFSLPSDDLARTAEELSGVPADRFSVLDMAPSSGPAWRYLRRLVGAVSTELLSDDSALESPLVYEQTLRTLCAAFLEAFPTSATGWGRPRPEGVTPRALRRAVDFIDANAERPLTLTEIAAAAGSSPRALQHAFARHRGTTPMAYVRSVRLHHAHRELQSADPTRGDTVAAVGRAWGFAKPGRFAAAYRETFGVNPSHTLRG